MLRRLCTARETKLQLAVSLARGHPDATKAKILNSENSSIAASVADLQAKGRVDKDVNPAAI
ncbi:hypothetical protein, partial [Clostridium perfringens]